MNILILGAGAIGVALGASYKKEGADVILYAREHTVREIREHGIQRTGIFGEIRIPAGEVEAVSTLSEVKADSVDVCLVTSKTLANEEISDVLEKNRGILKPGAKIVIMQNGWGNDVPFRRYFTEDEIFQARVITGFRRPCLNVSEITVHTAPILFGSLYGKQAEVLETLSGMLSESGIPSEVTDHLPEALWAKMLYNTTLNPLGAILHLSYGELSESAHAVAIMNRLISETFAVMDAAGYRTFWDSPESYRKEFYGKLLPDTYKHRSSTLQDIEKKQMTEIETLNGCIVRLAKEHGIPVPTHQMICDMIYALQENY